ncbi:MAG: tetratricopeptide repeat protein [Proteobacteria bacterium]|nr:tetratricopeptide repeat protein [Cystobacterineae bacterium]MCL2258766.1 tetratricopeptide repeat protein [Cystobacterineae bacterium]MCL2314385.1 tetratricopeptide repeat protein [Pseudomonadota bacterium]
MTTETSSGILGSLVPTTKTQARILLETGYLWMDMGRFVEAQEVFMGAALLMPKSEVPQLALGTLDLVQGRFEKALQTFRVAQRLAPKSALPHVHVGEALLFMGKEVAALKELQQAKQMEPEGDAAKFADSLLDCREKGLFSKEKPKVA